MGLTTALRGPTSRSTDSTKLTSSEARRPSQPRSKLVNSEVGGEIGPPGTRQPLPAAFRTQPCTFTHCCCRVLLSHPPRMCLVLYANFTLVLQPSYPIYVLFELRESLTCPRLIGKLRGMAGPIGTGMIINRNSPGCVL